MRYILFIIAIINIGIIQANTNNIDELPIGLTENEKNNINIIYEMGRETDPPTAPIRNIAEFERMSGALIRYPLGISLEIVRELAEDIKVYCLVSSSQQNNAINSFENAIAVGPLNKASKDLADVLSTAIFARLFLATLKDVSASSLRVFLKEDISSTVKPSF